ncbi:hypothetical protein ASD95_22335 [Pseudomonas sp. Root71]|nr:hypothetical protein ASD95_22335 [Pseudomonas sp. Root71]
MLVCATKVAALSTSLMVRVPVVEMSTAALVSLRLAIGAEDIHGDRSEGAIGTAHREAVGVGGAGGELVVGGVGDVGPGSAGADGELAVAAGGVGLRLEAFRAVDIADGQTAAGGQRSIGFAQRNAGRGQHGGVVAAGDGDSHQLGVDTAEAVADLHAEHFVVTLASRQRLHRTGDTVGAVGQRVRPLAGSVHGDRAVGACGRAIDGPGRRGVHWPVVSTAIEP